MTSPDVPTAHSSRGHHVSIEVLLADRAWIRSLARRLVADVNRVDDVEQRVWLAALRRPPTDGRRVRGWIATVVRNAVTDMFREDARRTHREREAGRPESAPSTSELAERADMQRKLLDAVVALPESLAQVILLRYFEGLPPKEIAARLNIPGGTVRSRISRGLSLLRERMDRGKGGRGAWITALAPLAWPDPFVSTSTVTTGVLVVKTKSKIAVALLLLLGLAVGWNLPAGGADEPTPKVAQTQVETPEPEKRTPAPRRAREPAPAPEPEPVAEPEPEPEAPQKQPEGRKLKLPDGRIITGDELKKLLKDGLVVKSGDAPVGGMTVPFRKGPEFPQAPETGTAVFEGTVVDSAGKILVGAQVFRLDEKAAGGQIGDVLSYEFAEEIAKTDGHGRWRAEGQPNRSFVLAANFNMLMNRPRGLQVTGRVRVDVAENETYSDIELRLPFDAATIGTITGRVLDPDGTPISAEIWRGRTHRVYAKKDGTFDMPGIPAGPVTLSIQKGGYRTATQEVMVAGMETSEVEIRLEYFETGPLEISGLIVDTEGTPIPDIAVFMGGTRQGSRWARTDEDGIFRFKSLPAEYAKRKVGLSIGWPGDGYFSAHRKSVKVPSRDLRIELTKATKVRIAVKAAEDGSPVPSSKYSLTRVYELDGEPKRHKFIWGARYLEDGVTKPVEAPVGRVEIEVQAPGRETTKKTVDLAFSEEPRVVEILLPVATPLR